MPPTTRRTGPSRAERREEVTTRILEVGRRHLADQGAAALSLRAVARDLGLVSSAVYRYVASRDELLTLLVVDAYTDLADHVDAAVGAGRGGVVTRVLTLARAMRTWALAHPAQYALLYGSPVPGYDAPGEVTSGPGTRVVLLLVRLLDEGAHSGAVATGAGRVPLPPALATDLAPLRAELGVRALDVAGMARGVFVWTSLLGALSGEVFGQLGAETLRRPELAFEHQVRLAMSVATDP